MHVWKPVITWAISRSQLLHRRLARIGWAVRNVYTYPFLYDLSAEWSHENLSVVVTARNLFIQGNERTRSLLASNYQCYGRDVSERDNSFASVKVAYSLDYGKKVNHSPKYESKAAESSILR